MPILIPFIPVIFTMTLIFGYALRNKYRYELKYKAAHRIGICALMSLVLWTGSSLILDPNFYAAGIGGNSSYLYTTARQAGFILFGTGISGVYGELLETKPGFDNKEYDLKLSLHKVWLAIYLLGAASAIVSGGFGFTTRATWGFYETRYISDDLMWLVEGLWFLLGVAALIHYFHKHLIKQSESQI